MVAGSAAFEARSASATATWQATATGPIGVSWGVTCEHFSIA
jgi:hypothetical protein